MKILNLVFASLAHPHGITSWFRNYCMGVIEYNSEHDISVPLKGLFEMGYHGRYIGSSSRRGTNIIEELGYKGSEEIETDFMHRVIYENISNEDLIHLVCRSGGVRTVLLAKQQGPSLN